MPAPSSCREWLGLSESRIKETGYGRCCAVRGPKSMSRSDDFVAFGIHLCGGRGVECQVQAVAHCFGFIDSD